MSWVKRLNFINNIFTAHYLRNQESNFINWSVLKERRQYFKAYFSYMQLHKKSAVGMLKRTFFTYLSQQSITTVQDIWLISVAKITISNYMYLCYVECFLLFQVPAKPILYSQLRCGAPQETYWTSRHNWKRQFIARVILFPNYTHINSSACLVEKKIWLISTEFWWIARKFRNESLLSLLILWSLIAAVQYILVKYHFLRENIRQRSSVLHKLWDMCI